MNRLVLIFNTFRGQTARMAVLIAAAIIDPSGASVNAIRTAIAAVTKALGDRASISKFETASVTPGSGAYSDDQDKAQITVVDQVGQYHNFKIPAPAASIFQADNETVDLTNALVTGWFGELQANYVTAGGDSFVGMIKGKRIRLESGRRK